MKQTEIGEIPESWRVGRLGEVVSQTQYGLSLRGNHIGHYPILRMNSLVNGRIDTNDLQYVDLDYKTFEKFKLNRGDVLFNRTNSADLVGKTALFDTDGDFIFASYLIRMNIDTNQAIPYFLNDYMNWDTCQQRLKMLASRGVSQSNINATKLSNFFVPIPPMSEQHEISDILYACDAKIAALEQEMSDIG